MIFQVVRSTDSNAESSTGEDDDPADLDVSMPVDNWIRGDEHVVKGVSQVSGTLPDQPVTIKTANILSSKRIQPRTRRVNITISESQIFIGTIAWLWVRELITA